MTTAYTPRAGSKVAAAYQALIDGPMSISDLGAATNLAPSTLRITLASAIKNDAIVELRDETGLAHFALAGMPVDERFLPAAAGQAKVTRQHRGRMIKDTQTVRHVTSHEPPSAAAIAAANPFRSIMPPAASQPTQRTTTAPPPATSSPDFNAGLFSNGEMLLTLGDQSMKLSPSHALQLRKFINAFQEQA